MEITMADSTNDLYQLQVSPLASSSEGGYFFFPTLVFHRSVGWRQGSGMKECLGDQEKQELSCRGKKKKPDLQLMDLGGWSYQTGQVTEGHVAPAEVVARGRKALKCHLLCTCGRRGRVRLAGSARWHGQVSL